MTRTDTVVVGTLVALLALVAGLIGGPAIQLAAAPRTVATAALGPSFEARGPTSKACSADRRRCRRSRHGRRPTATSSRRVRGARPQRPDGTIVPDLAERWSVDTAGKTWTVDMRPDARWQDG